jgi:hypothetical protein
MKVFISWSGERSESLAKALREWFPLVLHYVEPWLSKSDIEAGERWSVEIAKELEASNFGIICVTKENLNSPWILFEAGALAKSMQDGKVIPLLLDIDFKEVSGPLAQFQAKKAELPGVKELILSLNKSAKVPVPDTQLDKLFGALWPQLESQIGALPKSGIPAKHARPQGEILEELVSSVRNVEVRFRELMDDEFPGRRRRRSRMHPMMMRDMAFHIGEGPRDPIQILIVASLLREDFPWIYELALEAYRAIKSGKLEEARMAHGKFIEAIKMLRHGPFMEEFGMDSKWMQMILHEGISMFDIDSLELPDNKKPSLENHPTSRRDRK